MERFALATGRCALPVIALFVLSGCTVITVAGAAVGVAATGASTAVDVTVGTVKVGARVVGAVIPDEEEE